MRLNVRFSGAGGQGVILSSVLLAKAYGLGEDYYISQTQSYGPEARGGACKAEVVISDEDIDYIKVDEADVFIAFNQIGYNKYCNQVSVDAVILINDTLVEAEGERIHRVPATDIADEMGKPFVVNMVMLGALTKLLPKIYYPTVEAAIKKNFPMHIAEANLVAYSKGYKYMEEKLLENIEGGK